MPFQPTATRPTGSITLLFKGLLVLSGAADKACQVGVHKMTDDHFLIIEIRAKNDAQDSLVMRHAGPLTSEFKIKVDPPTDRGVFGFQRDTGRFDRSKPNDSMDFRWKIDLHDRDHFHPIDLQMFPAFLSPVISISDGTFYTHLLTDKLKVSSVPPSGAPKDLHRLAAIIGATIQLDELHTVNIDSGNGSPVILPRTNDPAGTNYVISVRNEPLAIGTGPDPDELERYYPALRKKAGGTVIPVAERFKVKATPTPLFKTDEIPCMPIVLGP